MDAQLKKILDEIGQRPLRSSIITATALIDAMLEKVLRKFLVATSKMDDIFSYNGAMGTFSAKICMAYALGIISKELHDDLNLFRKIRNTCAHEFLLDDQHLNTIKSQVGNFKLIKSTMIVGENEDVQIYTSLEFALIIMCLIKRLENVQRLTAYEFEVHDNYLAFTEEENSYITDFTSKMKAK